MITIIIDDDIRFKSVKYEGKRYITDYSEKFSLHINFNDMQNKKIQLVIHDQPLSNEE